MPEPLTEERVESRRVCAERDYDNWVNGRPLSGDGDRDLLGVQAGETLDFIATIDALREERDAAQANLQPVADQLNDYIEKNVTLRSQLAEKEQEVEREYSERESERMEKERLMHFETENKRLQADCMQIGDTNVAIAKKRDAAEAEVSRLRDRVKELENGS